jgi:uracil-DNA glycosylase
MVLIENNSSQLTQSLLSWWRDAGVEYVTEGEPMNWLSPEISAPVVNRFVEAPAANRIAVAPSAPEIQPNALLPAHKWPTDLAQLRNMVVARAALPGLNYGAATVLPMGEAGAIAMVIGDFPEEDEVMAGQFGAGPVAKLLGNMLFAAQIVPELTYKTTLALSRPATAALPKSDYSALAAFMNRQIDIVKPKLLILFGSAACEALLGAELMETRGRLAIINHHDRNTAAVATFHPRTLMAQPQLKAQAWKDLQVVVKKDYL